jgi:hypothetical protein
MTGLRCKKKRMERGPCSYSQGAQRVLAVPKTSASTKYDFKEMPSPLIQRYSNCTAVQLHLGQYGHITGQELNDSTRKDRHCTCTELIFLAVVCKIKTASQIETHVHSSGGSLIRC